MTRFPCALACEARHFLLDGEPRPLALRQPTPAHPVMADLSGREVGQPFFTVKSYCYLSVYICWKLLATFASQIQGNLEEFLRGVNYRYTEFSDPGCGWAVHHMEHNKVSLWALSRQDRNMGNHRILSFAFLRLIRVHPALPDSGQGLSKSPPETTQLTLKGCNAHWLFSPSG